MKKNSPIKNNHGLFHGSLGTDLVDSAFVTPSDFGDVLHFFDRQTAAGEVHMSVSHRVAVAHAVKQAAQLSVVFVGMMFRVAVGPINSGPQ